MEALLGPRPDLGRRAGRQPCDHPRRAPHRQEEDEEDSGASAARGQGEEKLRAGHADRVRMRGLV